MVSDKMQLGVIGLGKMGSDLAIQAADRGMYVAGHSEHRHPALEKQGIHTVDSYPGRRGAHSSADYLRLGSRRKNRR